MVALEEAVRQSNQLIVLFRQLCPVERTSAVNDPLCNVEAVVCSFPQIGIMPTNAAAKDR